MARLYISIELIPTTRNKLPRKITPLFIVNSPENYPAASQTCRKPGCYIQKQSKKINNTFYSNQPQLARTSLTTESFLNFCSRFQFKANQRKPNMYQSQDTLLLLSLPTASPCQQPPIRAYVKLSFTSSHSHLLLGLPLSLCQNDGADTLLQQA